MMASANDTPVPADDGACDHLTQTAVPELSLQATSGRTVNLATLRGRTVVYVYPRTSRPGEAPPSGWDEIPGARGCTPQSCAYRDNNAVLEDLGVNLFGLSTQDSAYQREAVNRLRLPFELLSDCESALTDALHLPTFTAGGMRLTKRLTLIVQDGRIQKVFYPVFPPEQDVQGVIGWLRANPAPG